ncbi:unnamed protein product [Kluyveromyces dobzhanskii CBS 2104]|uniref:WGS project CCBQ000000000 data, contig 00098 n=1 Tax=Kluyveromyces dobzhanskii CBS 2104 TaxID=1427455 RepID=A0A0A8L2Z6_9SACH|nr:unnamed protein product [Kluyveromyces dobzhanskii CBS 2104]
MNKEYSNSMVTSSSSVLQSEKKDVDVEHKEDASSSDQVPVANVLLDSYLGDADGAADADATEKNMTLLEGLRKYPKAVGWSLVFSAGLIMEGYDTAFVNNLFALPIFQTTFGEYSEANAAWEIPSRWQIGLGMCVYCGEIIGLQLTGFLANRYGNRTVLIGGLLLLIALNFILYFANSLAMIAVGQILCGIPWGSFQTLCVTYASEVCPLVLRYYLTTYINFCWLIGQLIAAGVLKACQEHLANEQLGWRLPFALQWMWPVPLITGIYLAPESPWWLVRKGRMEEARQSVTRILSLPAAEKDILSDMMITKMKMTVEKESRMASSESSYMDCFKGIDARRTRIACLTWVAQNLTGSTLMGYSTYFYEKAGLNTSSAFTFSVIQYVIGIAGTFMSWFLTTRAGRFRILFWGIVSQMIIMLITGGLGFSDSKGASWGAGSMLLIYNFFYNSTLGPVVYCVVSEIPSDRLRTNTIVLARNAYNLTVIATAVLTPYMLNSDQWNWGAKTGLFWGGFAALSMVWAYIDLPETKGRTFAELDELFHQKIPARKFASTHVEPFARETMMKDMSGNQDFNLEPIEEENFELRKQSESQLSC